MACPGIPALVQSLLQCGCDKMVSSHALPLAGGCLERGLPGGLSAPCLPVADAAHRLTGGGAQSLGHVLLLTLRLLSRRRYPCESPYMR